MLRRFAYGTCVWSSRPHILWGPPFPLSKAIGRKFSWTMLSIYPMYGCIAFVWMRTVCSQCFCLQFLLICPWLNGWDWFIIVICGQWFIVDWIQLMNGLDLTICREIFLENHCLGDFLGHLLGFGCLPEILSEISCKK